MPYKWNPFTNNLDLIEESAGDVVGPSSSTDENIAIFDGTTGKIIKDGGVGLPETDGELIIGDTAGNAKKATLTGGTGITVTNGAGSVTIDADNNGDVTAAASLDDFAVVCGDGGAKGVQTIASVGTTGQVLTSNGAGTLPTFEDAPSGTVVQSVSVSTTTPDSTTSGIPFDSSIPQQTEGKEIFTLDITPTDVSNILEITFIGNFGRDATSNFAAFALFQDSGIDALSTGSTALNGTAICQSAPLNFSKIAGTTSTTTFKMRYGPFNGSGTIYLNRSNDASNLFGNTITTMMIIRELKP